MTEEPDLSRFVDAQNPVIEQVRRELGDGRKRSHWMWFVFPQLAGLGHSAMARRYALSSLDEAKAYLRHSVLGPRLIECTELVNRVKGRSAFEILGSPDDLKFHSSITLFSLADPAVPAFQDALARYFAGKPDSRTLGMVGPS
ncbi:MAG: DUF1810 domain-containing protein [Acetobacteraceae bacterium]